MLDLSRDWDRNKWWLFDRLVESPHKTCFFIRRYPRSSNTENVEMDEAAQFWYVSPDIQDLHTTHAPVGITVDKQALRLHFLTRWRKLVSI